MGGAKYDGLVGKLEAGLEREMMAWCDIGTVNVNRLKTCVTEFMI